MFSFQKKQRREDLTMVKRLTRDAHLRHRVNLRPMLWDGALFLSLAAALSAIAFYGRPPHAPIVQLHQRPKFSYEAHFDFSYQSKTRLDNLRAAARLGVLPSFRVNTDALDARVLRYREFARELAASRDALAALPEPERVKRIADMPSALALGGSVRTLALSASRAVQCAGSGAYLEFLFGDALQQFDDLCRRGLYDDTTFGGAFGGDSAVRLLRDNTRRRELHVLDARKTLYTNLYYQAAGDAQPGAADQETARQLARALADILQPALTPNIDADLARTEAARVAAEAAVVPEPELVKAGTLLIERDVEVGQGTIERWRAYRDELAKRERMDFGLTRSILQSTLVGIAIVGVVILFTRAYAPVEPRRKRSFTLAAGAVVANLAMLRLGLEFSESKFATAVGGEAVTWGGVFVFAPLVTAVIAGPYVALIAMFLVAGFASAMHGNSLEMLLAIVLASLAAIRGVRNARLRSRIVTAGLVSAIPVALIAYYQVSGGVFAPEALRSAVAALVSGLLTGAVAAGVLPFLEKLFKTTTNITLLELTDYNHPLLRKLQLLAPGTFHHSVMVANIAERAAEDIRANALHCRCAALYHDIGKMVKPEYFIENQRHGANPHADISPSMSAIVIKSHVREGVEIAREYRLPRIVIDVIEQHHGTGLISYFFHKAKKACSDRTGALMTSGMDACPLPPPDTREVDESIYRYDGPKPRSREAAILLLADSVEAASRSLKKVTPQTVEELVDAIVDDRIADGQLDDCPLSFREVQRLRSSLKKSLINCLHQRVEYPSDSPRPSKAALVNPPAGPAADSVA